jgi:hypothetical protein
MSTCISGDHCDEIAVESHSFQGVYWFCEGHQARLDAVKETMGDQAWSKALRDDGTKPEERICAEEGCGDRPVYGSEYCADCAATVGF